MPKTPKILLSGRPGSGKTTVIQVTLDRIDRDAAGFFTSEIRKGRKRTGFSLQLLSGEEHTLASVDFESPHRVSKYGVDIDVLDAVAVPEIERAIEDRRLLVVDEIGKMELFSEAFQDAVERAFDSGIPILGTILSKSHPFADRIRQRDDVEIVEVTESNRDRLPDRLAERFAS